MNKISQITQDSVSLVAQAIGKLESAKQYFEDEIEKIDEALRQLRSATDEVAPSSKIKPDGYSDLKRVEAMQHAFNEIDSNPFGANEIKRLILESHPHMFRNSKRGREQFSNIYWRVAKDMINQQKIGEVQKGGGRKPTLFSKLNHAN